MKELSSGKKATPPVNFKTTAVPDVPPGRNGKHKQIVTQILFDVNQVPEGLCLRFH